MKSNICLKIMIHKIYIYTLDSSLTALVHLVLNLISNTNPDIFTSYCSKPMEVSFISFSLRLINFSI